MVAQAAANSAERMRKSKPFAAYLESYRAAGHEAPPLLMIGRIANDTTTVLHTEALTERIATSLSEDGGMVQVTTAVAGAGQHRDAANAQVRDLENDDNFNRDTVQKRGTLRAPDLSLTGSVSYTDNNYPDVVYGVTKDHFLVSSIDVGYTPVSGINTHLFYSYQEVGSALEINSSSANNGVDWKLQTSDDIHTVGTGVEWQLNPKLKLSLDDSLSFARTTYGITSRQRNTASPTETNTGTDLPDTLTIQNSLRLSGEYEVEDGITLGLTGQWEHLMSKDYLNVQEAASTSNTTSQTVLISGTGDPSYDVGVLMATAKIKW